MRLVYTIAIVASIVAAAPSSNAQLTSAPASAPTSQPSGSMDNLIKSLSGHWSLQLKFEPSKEAPNGFESTGEETWHAGPGNLTLSDEEVFHVGPQSMLIFGLLWRDLKTNDFHALDCNNEGPRICDIKGSLDVVVHWTGSVLTIDEQEPTPQGKMMISRVVWSDITPTSFTESGYLGEPGGVFKKGMTIHATRADK